MTYVAVNVLTVPEGGGEVLERVREEWCQCLGRPNLNEGM